MLHRIGNRLCTYKRTTPNSHTMITIKAMTKKKNGWMFKVLQDLHAKVMLIDNDILFIGTDGITEAIQDVSGSEEVQYGEERLMTLLKETARTPLEEIKSKLLQDLALFTNNTYADDVTFLMIKVLVSLALL